MIELWDAYLKTGELAGCDLIRGEVIPDGLYHLVSNIIVRHIDGSFLVMQRDYGKPNYPGMFEASAGGSALKGERGYEAALRELEEETGIIADNLKLVYKDVSNDTIYEGFLCVTDCDKDSIKLQAGETISYRWLDEKEFLKFMESDLFVPPCRKRIKNFLGQIDNIR